MQERGEGGQRVINEPHEEKNRQVGTGVASGRAVGTAGQALRPLQLLTTGAM